MDEKQISLQKSVIKILTGSNTYSLNVTLVQDEILIETIYIFFY